jgi:hypothetical protein
MLNFEIMDQTGHTTLSFETTTDELARAEAKFYELVAERYTPFKRPAGAAPTEPLVLDRIFDPTAEDVMFRPQLQGG